MGLFWWSADSTSTSNAPAANSCTACLVQATPVGPFTSRYGPDVSFITPMRMIGRDCAREHTGMATATAVVVSSERRHSGMIGSLARRTPR